MSTHKNINLICVIAIVLAMLVTVAFMNGERLGLTSVVDEDAETFTESKYFTANDLDGDWDASEPTATITLNGDSAKISGNGAYYYDGDVYITGGGKYVVSGSLDDGSIIVDAYNSSKVWVLLNGVDIYCSDNAAFRVDKADKVFLTLAEGTENSLESGSEYSDSALNDNINGAVWAADDLTINGSGSLTVTAGYKHGIKVKDSLTVTGGTIVINAAQDGIHTNDEFLFASADLTITAGDDAVHSDTTIYAESGTILITDCYEGFEAHVIEMAGGNITIYTRDDGFNANGGSDSFGFGNFGNFGGMSGQENNSETEDASEDVSSEEDECYISISGGKLTIINETANDADGLDSNGDIYITGGDIRISLPSSGNNCAIDYGSESGGVCEISGGTVIACGSYSMAESFDSTSAQCSALYNFSNGAAAGTFLELYGSDGTVLLSWEVPCSFNSVNLSSPKMQTGETYTLVIGDQYDEIEISEISASYGDAQSGGFGGMMNWGKGMSDMPSDFSGGFPGDGKPGKGGSESSDSSDRPQRPSFDGSTEHSDSSERPSRPSWDDNSESSSEHPDSSFGDGEMPSDMGGMPGGFGGPDMDSGDAADEETAVSAGVSLSELSTSHWIWLGASLAALVLGLATAIIYARRR